MANMILLQRALNRATSTALRHHPIFSKLKKTSAATSSSFSSSTFSSTSSSYLLPLPRATLFAKRLNELNLTAASSRHFSADKKIGGSESAVSAKDDDKIPDRVEMATGMEKKQLLALLHGDDRYEPKIYAPAPGTKEEPNIVPVTGETRLVGCICEPDQHYINYMILNLGEMKRCECGYWFKSVKGDPDIF